jgi:hypothetical protein
MIENIKDIDYIGHCISASPVNDPVESDENIECVVCGAKNIANTYYTTKQFYTKIPEGWMFCDSYPPGDSGIEFVCSKECTERYIKYND